MRRLVVLGRQPAPVIRDHLGRWIMTGRHGRISSSTAAFGVVEVWEYRHETQILAAAEIYCGKPQWFDAEGNYQPYDEEA